MGLLLRWPAEYDRDPNVVYALDDQMRIVKANSAWDTFAIENNGSEARFNRMRDIPLFTVIPTVLQKFYYDLFVKTRRTGRETHVFDCSSARVLRRLRMTVSVFGDGLLIRNVSVKESLALPSEANGELSDYGPRVHMCAHCRRVENHSTHAWQWIPELIERMPADLRSGLCPECYVYHYGRAEEEAGNAASA
jgi:hypothetical protein